MPDQERGAYKVINDIKILNAKKISLLDKMNPSTDDKDPLNVDQFDQIERTDLSDENLFNEPIVNKDELEFSSHFSKSEEMVNLQNNCTDSYLLSLLKTRNHNPLKYGLRVMSCDKCTVNFKNLKEPI